MDSWVCLRDIPVWVFVWTPVGNSLVSLSRSPTPGPYGSSVLNSLTNCQTDFHSSCAPLHSQQHCLRVLISERPQLSLLFSVCLVFFIMAILLGVQCYFMVLVICISQMANDVAHIFLSFVALCARAALPAPPSSPWSSSTGALCPFWEIGSNAILLLSSLYIMENWALSDVCVMWFVNISPILQVVLSLST